MLSSTLVWVRGRVICDIRDIVLSPAVFQTSPMSSFPSTREPFNVVSLERKASTGDVAVRCTLFSSRPDQSYRGGGH